MSNRVASFVRIVLVSAVLVGMSSAASAQAPVTHAGSSVLHTLDLMTTEGVAAMGGQWRFSDVRIVEVPTDPPPASGTTYDIDPHANGIDYDDSKWLTIEPKALNDRRGNRRLSFGWYRITLIMPEKVAAADVTGTKAYFSITFDDYAEVWVNGQLPRTVGKPSPNAVAGFNTPNRVLLTESVKPGEKIQVAVFGMNGPISVAPNNPIFVREAKVEFVR